MAPPNGITPGGGGVGEVSRSSPYLPVPTVDSASTSEAEEALKRSEDPAAPEEAQLLDRVSDAEVVVPPDGGWGWVVVAASFFCNMVVDGIIFAFAMFLADIRETFSASTTDVALVSSLMSGFYLIAGPFVSALANRYGFATVAVGGSVFAALAFAVSSFATSVQFLWISFGIFGGIGFGLIYVPAVITVGFYFERWRALATGIAVCGSGIGSLVFAPLIAYLVARLGWRHALLCQAAVVLLCVVAAAMFRPLKPKKLKELERQLEAEERREAEMPGAGAGAKARMAAALDQMTRSSVSLGPPNNNNAPTAATALSRVYHTVHAHHPLTAADLAGGGGKRRSLHSFFESEAAHGGAAEDGGPLLDARGASEPREAAQESGGGGGGDQHDVNRPLYRDDIFFAGSLARLPQYNSKVSLAYTLSVTHLPTLRDVEEEKRGGCRLCPEAVKRALAAMLDFGLLRSPSFLLLAVSGFFTMMGFYVPFMFLTTRATDDFGIRNDTALWLIPSIGIANTVGRVLCGILSSFPGVNALFVNNVALSIGGLATFLSGLSTTAEYQFTYCAVFGLSTACFASLRSIIVVDLMGLERLTNAFGLLLLFQGVAAVIGAPLASAFRDLTNSPNASFYFSGGLILFSALITFPLNCVNRWERARSAAAAGPTKAVPV